MPASAKWLSAEYRHDRACLMCGIIPNGTLWKTILQPVDNQRVCKRPSFSV